jgi:hypothetical protein
MSDLTFYNDGRDADKRLFIEWPKGMKTDILTKEGKYLFSCNRTPEYIGVFCLVREIPINVLFVDCEPDTRDEKNFLARRPARYLLDSEVQEMFIAHARKTKVDSVQKATKAKKQRPKPKRP